mgnify:CR=1 FL=1|jgi:hypothetical protein
MEIKIAIVSVILFLMSCTSTTLQKLPLSSFDSNSIVNKNRYIISFEKNGINENLSTKGKRISMNQNGDFVVDGQVIPKKQLNQITEKQKNGSYWAWGILGGVVAGLTQTVVEAANAGYCDGCPVGVQGVIYVPVYSLIGAGIGALIPKYRESRVFKNE